MRSLILWQNKDGSGDSTFAPIKEVTQFLVVHARSSKVFVPTMNVLFIYFSNGSYVIPKLCVCFFLVFPVNTLNVSQMFLKGRFQNFDNVWYKDNEFQSARMKIISILPT